MSKQFRLKEHHSTYQKYQQLYELADKLGITLCFAAGVCVIEDVDKPGITFYLEDIEDNHIITSFPHPTETKIVYREK